MEKVFNVLQTKNGTVPYSVSKICFSLTEYAKGYVNSKNDFTDTNLRDAVLVDTINFIGAYDGCDFGVYATDLYDKFSEERVIDEESLLTIMINYFSTYMFDYDFANSIIKNSHIHNFNGNVPLDEVRAVLIDFINYVLRINEYDNVVTVEELCKKYSNKKFKREMSELKSFLLLTGKYCDMLEEDIDIDVMFEFMARKYNLKNIDSKGTYHYTDSLANRFDRSEFFDCDKIEVDEEIYAMGYAFYKMKPEKFDNIQTSLIKEKILEMKRK